jgi:hypothetical protein
VTAATGNVVRKHGEIPIAVATEMIGASAGIMIAATGITGEITTDQAALRIARLSVAWKAPAADWSKCATIRDAKQVKM